MLGCGVEEGSIGWSLGFSPSFGPWLSCSEPTMVPAGPEAVFDTIQEQRVDNRSELGMWVGRRDGDVSSIRGQVVQ